MEPGVKRVWITFETVSHSLLPALIRQEVGVTAQTEQTAIALVRYELGAPTAQLPPVLEVLANIEVSAVDEQHSCRTSGGALWDRRSSCRRRCGCVAVGM